MKTPMVLPMKRPERLKKRDGTSKVELQYPRLVKCLAPPCPVNKYNDENKNRNKIQIPNLRTLHLLYTAWGRRGQETVLLKGLGLLQPFPTKFSVGTLSFFSIAVYC